MGKPFKDIMIAFKPNMNEVFFPKLRYTDRFRIPCSFNYAKNDDGSETKKMEGFYESIYYRVWNPIAERWNEKLKGKLNLCGIYISQCSCYNGRKEAYFSGWT